MKPGWRWCTFGLVLDGVWFLLEPYQELALVAVCEVTFPEVFEDIGRLFLEITL
jgi:hypothetical protein